MDQPLPLAHEERVRRADRQIIHRLRPGNRPMEPNQAVLAVRPAHVQPGCSSAADRHPFSTAKKEWLTVLFSVFRLPPGHEIANFFGPSRTIRLAFYQLRDIRF